MCCWLMFESLCTKVEASCLYPILSTSKKCLGLQRMESILSFIDLFRKPYQIKPPTTSTVPRDFSSPMYTCRTQLFFFTKLPWPCKVRQLNKKANVYHVYDTIPISLIPLVINIYLSRLFAFTISILLFFTDYYQSYFLSKFSCSFPSCGNIIHVILRAKLLMCKILWFSHFQLICIQL